MKQTFQSSMLLFRVGQVIAVVIKKTQNLSSLTHNSLFLTLRTFTVSPSALQGRSLTNSDLEIQVASILQVHYLEDTAFRSSWQVKRAGGSRRTFYCSGIETTHHFCLQSLCNPSARSNKWHCLTTRGWEVNGGTQIFDSC